MLNNDAIKDFELEKCFRFEKVIFTKKLGERNGQKTARIFCMCQDLPGSYFLSSVSLLKIPLNHWHQNDLFLILP